MSFYRPESTRGERLRANALINKRLKLGYIQRPLTFDECCKQSNWIEGHHDDYSQPDVVRWLCVGCHKARHGRPFPPRRFASQTFVRLNGHRPPCTRSISGRFDLSYLGNAALIRRMRYAHKHPEFWMAAAVEEIRHRVSSGAIASKKLIDDILGLPFIELFTTLSLPPEIRESIDVLMEGRAA